MTKSVEISPYLFAYISLEVYNKAADDPLLNITTTSNGFIRNPTGWELLDFGSACINEDTGFFAKVLRSLETNQTIIAFRGTDFSDTNVLSILDDLLVSDAQLARGVVPEQYYDAKVLVDTVIASGIQPNSIHFTGHSLGAFLAQLCAAKYARPAVVFDSPGPGRILDMLMQDPNNGFSISSKFDLYDLVINYNAAPNLVNTASGFHPEKVYRIHKPFDFSPLVVNDPIQILYLLQQHSIGSTFKLFNPVSGQPKIASDMTHYWDLSLDFSDSILVNWPYHELSGLASYTSGFTYVSRIFQSNYAQNPYYLDHVWGDKGYYEKLELIESSHQSTARRGMLIIGDDTGNVFFSGTNYADEMRGGKSNDEYWPYAGNNIINDSGGDDKYFIVSYSTYGITTINDIGNVGSIYLHDFGCSIQNLRKYLNSAGQNVYAFIPHLTPSCAAREKPAVFVEVKDIGTQLLLNFKGSSSGSIKINDESPFLGINIPSDLPSQSIALPTATLGTSTDSGRTYNFPPLVKDNKVYICNVVESFIEYFQSYYTFFRDYQQTRNRFSGSHQLKKVEQTCTIYEGQNLIKIGEQRQSAECIDVSGQNFHNVNYLVTCHRPINPIINIDANNPGVDDHFSNIYFFTQGNMFVKKIPFDIYGREMFNSFQLPVETPISGEIILRFTSKLHLLMDVGENLDIISSAGGMKGEQIGLNCISRDFGGWSYSTNGICVTSFKDIESNILCGVGCEANSISSKIAASSMNFDLSVYDWENIFQVDKNKFYKLSYQNNKVQVDQYLLLDHQLKLFASSISADINPNVYNPNYDVYCSLLNNGIVMVPKYDPSHPYFFETRNNEDIIISEGVNYHSCNSQKPSVLIGGPGTNVFCLTNSKACTIIAGTGKTILTTTCLTYSSNGRLLSDAPTATINVMGIRPDQLAVDLSGHLTSNSAFQITSDLGDLYSSFNDSQTQAAETILSISMPNMYVILNLPHNISQLSLYANGTQSIIPISQGITSQVSLNSLESYNYSISTLYSEIAESIILTNCNSSIESFDYSICGQSLDFANAELNYDYTENADINYLVESIPSQTPTPSPTASITPSISSIPSGSLSPSPSSNQIATITHTPTITPSSSTTPAAIINSASASPIPSPSATKISSPSSTPSISPLSTPSPSNYQTSNLNETINTNENSQFDDIMGYITYGAIGLGALIISGCISACVCYWRNHKAAPVVAGAAAVSVVANSVDKISSPQTFNINSDSPLHDPIKFEEVNPIHS